MRIVRFIYPSLRPIISVEFIIYTQVRNVVVYSCVEGGSSTQNLKKICFWIRFQGTPSLPPKI